MNKEEKRRMWKEKFEVWFANHVEEHKIKKTKNNPNGVTIGCWLNPNDSYNNAQKDGNTEPTRRYV